MMMLNFAAGSLLDMEIFSSVFIYLFFEWGISNFYLSLSEADSWYKFKVAS
jgi:hypothetical protein